MSAALREVLQLVAGPRAFARGEAYALDGRVRSLDQRASVLTAIVDGTAPYSVRVRVSDDPNEIDGSCDCPVGVGGTFCKHCVATALTWLKRREQRRANADAERLRSLLSKLDADALRRILLEEALREDALLARLLLRTGREDVDALRTALDRAVANHGAFVPYAEAAGYARGIDEAIDAIEELIEIDPAAAVGLAEHGLRAIEAAIERVDDSDGCMGGLLARLQDIHLRACERAKPDPTELAERMFRWEQDSELEVFHRAAERYGEVLGPVGLSRYRDLASEIWEHVPARGPGDERSSMSYFRISSTMESIALATGDFDALIEVMTRDLSSPWSFHRVAEACRQAGRVDEAVEWARRGIDAFPDSRDFRLATLLAELYGSMGNREEAASAALAALKANPGLETWRRLRNFAQAAGSWEAHRAEGLTHLERVATARKERAANTGYGWERFPAADELVAVFLDEDQPDDAWDAAVRYGASDGTWLDLARRRGRDHPDDALGVYKRLVERSIAVKDRRAYRDAVALLKELRELLDTCGRIDEFEALLDQIRQTHARKRALLDELEQAQDHWEDSGHRPRKTSRRLAVRKA